jgi:hypothetical protein
MGTLEVPQELTLEVPQELSQNALRHLTQLFFIAGMRPGLPVLWQTFFAMTVGAQIPAIVAMPLWSCGCRTSDLCSVKRAACQSRKAPMVSLPGFRACTCP